ncbi:MAG: hypothetical protein M3041_10165 [Acidobacteriota bacterium]|nr:hypothetical protein [Acidobacteriota bacterium]
MGVISQAAPDGNPSRPSLRAEVDGPHVLFVFDDPVTLRRLRVTMQDSPSTAWWEISEVPGDISGEDRGDRNEAALDLSGVFDEFKRAVESEPIDRRVKWIVYGSPPKGFGSQKSALQLIPTAFEVLAVADEGRFTCLFVIPEASE